VFRAGTGGAVYSSTWKKKVPFLAIETMVVLAAKIAPPCMLMVALVAHRSDYGRASCDDARLTPCVVDEAVQCSLSSCCLSSHAELPGAFEQPIQESLLRPAMHAVRTT
jgi:hypothetical protein